MKKHLYLSLIPESLIASMLGPEDFGNYLAVGTRKRSRGQAIFFEVDMDSLGEEVREWLDLLDRCEPHPDGKPKRSLYLSIYRVLERIPLAALQRLHLVTDDGRVLSLDPQPCPADDGDELHFYQELCPVTPRVVSSLGPCAFSRFITQDNPTFSLPKIVFCDLILRGLRDNPDVEDIGDLPYLNIGHLRDCLRELRQGEAKRTKTVDRQLRGEILYRTIKSGVFVGEGDTVIQFAMPPKEKLEREYYEWWRSALTPSLQ